MLSESVGHRGSTSPPLGNNFHYDFLIVYSVGNSPKKVSNFFLAQHWAMALEKSQNQQKNSFLSITPKLLTFLNYSKKEKALLAVFTYWYQFLSHSNHFRWSYSHQNTDYGPWQVAKSPKNGFSSLTPKLLTILNYPKKEKALLAFFTI